MNRRAAFVVGLGLISASRPHPVIVLSGLSGLGVVQVLDPATVETIAAAIERVEGYYPGSLAWRNNNPGNLIYAGQRGATRGDGGFARFASYAEGRAALADQIQLYAARGMSIAEMMAVYAPASDGNDPAGYAATVAAALGVDPAANLLNLAPANPLAAVGDMVQPVGFLDGLAGFDPLTLAAVAAGVVLLGVALSD